MWNSKIILLFYFLNNIVEITNSVQIHENLVQCYRGSETEPWVGNTLQIMLELIRKIEDANPTSLDIRLLSVHLLHRLRIDGIENAPGIRETEFVTPFRANGIMTPKFWLLLKLVSNVPGILNFEDFLTTKEICLLHRLISSSVEPYERGDENIVCPLTLMSAERVPAPWINQNKVQDPNSAAVLTVSARLSRCPLEYGVIRSHDYGSFSPGTLIASIAAGLQPQNVRISDFVSLQSKKSPWENLETMNKRDTKLLDKLLRSLDSMDNTYASGLAGDLAEVCLYQGPYLGTNSSIGLAGAWNDTYFPKLRYLSENHGARWEMTDSEILSGIDGLFLSQQIASWVGRIRRLRLSQIIEMYYSSRGIPTMAIETTNKGRNGMMANKVNAIKNRQANKDIEEIEEKFELDKHLDRFSVSDGITSGCDRRTVLRLIDRDKLKDETYFLSQVLQFTTSSMAISDELLRNNCDAAVNRFFEYAEILLDTLPGCNDIFIDYRKPTVDLTLIIDGSRRKYENNQLIFYISEAIDVCSYGSSISVIHGTNGIYLVNRTNSVTTAFEQLSNYTDPFPTSLSLSRSLSSFLFNITNITRHEQSIGLMGGLPTVLLIVAQDQKISQTDFESARRMILGPLQRFPDLYFIFITNDIETIQELIDGTLMWNNVENSISRIRRQEQYRIINANSIQLNDIASEVSKILKTIPKRIMAPFCENQQQQFQNGIFNKNYFEDYATPNQEIRYRISTFYLVNTNEIRVQFQGVSYGEFTVCLARETTYTPLECKTINEFNAEWFNITRPCPDITNCQAVYFSILLDKTEVRCAENDCRYPDQVRFVVRHEGLRCETDTRLNGLATMNSFGFNLSLFLFYVIIIVNYNFF